MIAEVMERNDTVKIIRYDTLESLLEKMWGCSVDELRECKFGGVNEQGKEFEYSFDELFRSIDENGCYGCMDKDGIYIWIGGNAGMADVVHLIAHERAHFEYTDEGDESIRDEIRCEIAGNCARYAYENAVKLMEELM